MLALVLILLGVGIIAAIIGMISQHKKEEDKIVQSDSSNCATCDGTNTKCEQECMLETATKEIEYFDDEELDRFKGRPSCDFSDDEVEEFREIMYTMKPIEVKDWNRSLILRGVNIPDQMKDEVIMLINN